jgi:hypothetical protein
MIVVGTYRGPSELGEPLVDFAGNPSPGALPARSLVPLAAAEMGREVVIAFDSGDRRRPIVLGALVRSSLETGPNPAVAAIAATAENPAEIETQVVPARVGEGVEIERDGDRIVLEADREIVLRCGEASLTLTRAGKVLIRGTYVLSRSSGVNRLKGGSVQIN